ncbi:secreted protein [Betaproteobacteria bacterium]|nr:secreted protein [Betaproteobacteria bacterium]
MSAIRPTRSLVNGLLIAAVLTSACATTVARDTGPAPRELPSRAMPAPPDIVPVTRQGRYTLLELTPEPAQRHLMRQIVEVSIPPTLDTNVGDALRHVLLHSGYRLCDTPEAATLYAFPLPASHWRLGPMTLRNALLMLAGPAWELSVDEASRQVCFKPVSVPDVPDADIAKAGRPQP